MQNVSSTGAALQDVASVDDFWSVVFDGLNPSNSNPQEVTNEGETGVVITLLLSNSFQQRFYFAE